MRVRDIVRAALDGDELGVRYERLHARRVPVWYNFVCGSLRKCDAVSLRATRWLGIARTREGKEEKGNGTIPGGMRHVTEKDETNDRKCEIEDGAETHPNDEDAPACLARVSA